MVTDSMIAHIQTKVGIKLVKDHYGKAIIIKLTTSKLKMYSCLVDDCFINKKTKATKTVCT